MSDQSKALCERVNGSLGRMVRYVLLVALVGVCANAASAAKPSDVRLEIVQVAGTPLESPQEWLRGLQRLGLGSLRIRAARPGDASRVQSTGTGRTQQYNVTAVLNGRGELELPNRVRIRRGGVGEFKDWLQQLGADAQSGSENSAFGFSETELVELYDQLAAPVEITTVGISRTDALRHVASVARIKLEVQTETRRTISRSPALRDEFKGLASGTALAAILRPIDLVAEPRQDPSRGPVMRIRHYQQVKEAWPIGWPPEVREGELVPALLERFPVQMTDTPLTTAMSALQQRLAIPVIYDRQAIDKKGIKLQAVKVNVPKSQTFYKRVLSRVLAHARLEMQLRVDEGQRPFIWVRPIQLDR